MEVTVRRWALQPELANAQRSKGEGADAGPPFDPEKPRIGQLEQGLRGFGRLRAPAVQSVAEDRSKHEHRPHSLVEVVQVVRQAASSH